MLARAGWGRDLFLLLPLLAVLFGFNLGGRALWSPVEGRYSEIPREMVVSGDYVTPRLNGVRYFEKPPLFYWLQALSIRLFGLNEWSLRFWNALFAALGCAAVYAAGRDLFGRRAGWIASLVLASSPLYYAMARVITVDMALSFFLSCGLIAFLLGTRKAPGRSRRLRMWTFYVFIALATLTKGLVGILLSALVIGFWIGILGQWKILKAMYLPSGIVLYAAIAVPWHIMVSRANPEFAGFYFIHEHFQRYLLEDQAPLRQAWVYIPVLLVGFFPWVAFLIQSVKNNLGFSWYERWRHQEQVFLGLWALLTILFFSASNSQLFTYILPAFPPLALLIGRTFSSWWDAEPGPGCRAGIWAAAIAMALLALVFGFSGLQHGLERYSNWPSLNTPSDDTTVPSTKLASYPDLAKLRPYVYAQGAVLLCGTAALLLARRRGLRGVFPVLGATTVVLLILVDSGFTLLDERRSVKDLAAALNPRLHPADEVATYHAYYQDLPVYIQRRVTVVEWSGELDFGAQAEDTSGWIIDEAEFWRRWKRADTMYAVTDRENYKRLIARGTPNIYLVRGNDYNVVFSNQR
jgi:4-amino-4-deoxy-L-arabinose transferase-like glycosyltransferase